MTPGNKQYVETGCLENSFSGNWPLVDVEIEPASLERTKNLSFRVFGNSLLKNSKSENDDERTNGQWFCHIFEK